MKWHGKVALVLATVVTLFGVAGAPVAKAQQKKPNILVVFGDDVGYWNVSAYNRGMTGYKTPNIDRIAHEGALFTDYYAQQSCTAGRAAFIAGQSPIRTGLTLVGVPGSTIGLQKQDPTIAELLKPLGYMTFQNGKNHLGDRNEFLPTVHGFDEFFGNLYHLDAEEEPENMDYPKDPAFAAKFGPRGVLKCKATAADNPAPFDPRFGAWGKQSCEDTGPLTIERMKTADEEFLAASLDATPIPSSSALLKVTSNPQERIRLRAYVEGAAKTRGVNPQVADWIVTHESQHHPEATGDGGESRGLWQINKVWHPEVSDACAYNIACSTDWSLERIRAGHIVEWSTWKYCKERFEDCPFDSK